MSNYEDRAFSLFPIGSRINRRSGRPYGLPKGHCLVHNEHYQDIREQGPGFLFLTGRLSALTQRLFSPPQRPSLDFPESPIAQERAEEVLALHWSGVDFGRLTVHVSKAVVHGRIKTVKTEYSEDELPLDPDFATVLLQWKARAPASALMFPSHITGRYFHASPIQQDYIRPAGCCLVACPQFIGLAQSSPRFFWVTCSWRS